ncbi:MAG: hypothetical protein GY772_19830 [bacterium]|nr:hypothetical protein [bacterium]
MHGHETQEPGFKYTTIELNRNYAAKMHVDRNNRGPSRIIALGNYTDDDFWLADETNGTMKMEVIEPMRGWPHLKVDFNLKGIVHSIRDSWFIFDGTVSHCVLPLQGNRILVVYFTRAKYLTMKDDVTMTLLQHGFNTPRRGVREVRGQAQATATF